MTAALRPIIVIPARLAATRLPDKPLADIHGAPMIVHVWRRAVEADLGPVVVAAGEAAIAEAVTQAGGAAVLTDPDLPSGSDRVCAALAQADPDGTYNVVVNLQGDLPAIDPQVVRASVEPLLDPKVDIATLAVPITDAAERADPNVVKAVLAGTEPVRRALYFSRAAVPYTADVATTPPAFHHVGIYAYRRDALMRFVELPPSPLEKLEKLEQLRALEAGMRIDAALVETVPLGVDTPDDLDRIRAHFSQ